MNLKGRLEQSGRLASAVMDPKLTLTSPKNNTWFCVSLEWGCFVSAALSYFIVHDHSNIVNPRQSDL